MNRTLSGAKPKLECLLPPINRGCPWHAVCMGPDDKSCSQVISTPLSPRLSCVAPPQLPFFVRYGDTAPLGVSASHCCYILNDKHTLHTLLIPNVVAWTGHFASYFRAIDSLLLCVAGIAPAILYLAHRFCWLKSNGNVTVVRESVRVSRKLCVCYIHFGGHG